MSTMAIGEAPQPGWLRNKTFDLGFIGVPTALALVSGAVVVAQPGLFPLVLALDVWFLGYHHVVSTYTRLCFDRESFRQHRFLVIYLPFIVFALTLALAAGVGIWAIATVYLYWQWFHYTRQSWGVSQVYRRKSIDLVGEGELLTKLAFYLLPLWGILYRSWQAPETFLALEIRVLPVPGLLVDLVGAAAFGSILLWAAFRTKAFLQGRGAIAHTLYMASHWTIFAVGYVFIEDITYGWLVINIWHNAQYVLFVWLYNANRFRNGRDERAPFLSRISQPSRAWIYFAVCLAVATTLYVSIFSAKDVLLALGLPSLIVIYQTINFHHYIVDSLIWKARKKPMQKTLGLSAG